MTRDKYEQPLHLDMDFDEAFRRFAQTDKAEADELASQSKKKRPPGDDPPAAKTRKTATPSRRTKSDHGD